LEAAVRPSKLEDVLASLRGAGVLADFDVGLSTVTITGDVAALEAALELGPAVATSDAVGPSAREAYFDACRSYTHTAAFRRLSPRDRLVWQLHASGASRGAICWALDLSPNTVRWAIERLRLEAGLPRATCTRPKSGHRRCAVEGCERTARALGLCRAHYKRLYRQGKPRSLRDRQASQSAGE